MMKKYFIKNKGITLIALVVTIIVLLILAGISIATLTGDNGILKRATESKEKNLKAIKIEKIDMLLVEYSIDKNTKGISFVDWIKSKYHQLSGTIDDIEYEILDGRNGEQIVSFTISDNLERTFDNDGNEIINEIIKDYETLLKVTGIAQRTTKEEIAINEKGELDKIISNSKAVDYIIDNYDEFAKVFSQSEIVIEKLGQSEYAANKIIGNMKWSELISNSEYSDMFDKNAITVPLMTSNTEPSGECFSTQPYRNMDRYNTYRCFDQNYNTDFAYNGTGECYIGYKFTQPVNIYKVVLIQRGADGNGPGAEGLVDVTLYYSDDDKEYIKASDTIQLRNTAQKQKFMSYFPGKHLYWKIVSSRGYGSNGGLTYLQFYGK